MAPSITSRTGLNARPCPARGFTLVELLVVMVVAAILAVVAAPAFSDLIAAQRTRAAASSLQDSLWLARSEALKRNRPVAFTVSSLADGWVLRLADEPTTVLRVQAGFPGLQLTISVAGTEQESVEFIYNPAGRLAAGSAATRMTVSNGDPASERCIRFDAVARALVDRGACT